MYLSVRIALFSAGLVALVGLLVFSVRRPAPPLPSPDSTNELVVLIRPGPIVYFPGPDGALAGLDVELARLFAAEKQVPLRFVLADSPAAVIAALAKGQAHIGAGGLFRPMPGVPAPTGGDCVIPPMRRFAPLPPEGASTLGRPCDAHSPDAEPDSAAAYSDVSWTTGYATAEPVLIYNRDGYKPAKWRDLDGASVGYVDDAGFESEIAAVRTAHPRIAWQGVTAPAASVISQVSDGTLSYAVVGSIAAAVARNIYLDFEVAFPAGGKRDIAWAVSTYYMNLRPELDAFLARLQSDGTLAKLRERYVSATRTIERIDAGALAERARTLLPKLRPLFQDAQERTGVEWRLLAAIAYQESQWDPGATSETGVRGLMQITEETARHLGIRNLLDPAQNVLGGALYLRTLKMKLPSRIPEPERTWLALAAFNIGLGHLEDARILAQRQKLNPDAWSDVKQVLPLLALPEYYERAKLGYARGGMPVAFVDRVRGYYDVLLAQQTPHEPRLRMFADAPEHGLSRFKPEFMKK